MRSQKNFLFRSYFMTVLFIVHVNTIFIYCSYLKRKWEEPSAIDGGMPAHIVTNKKRWNGARKGVSGDPTLMLKSMAGEFDLIRKIGVLVNLLSFWESNGVFLVYHIFRWMVPLFWWIWGVVDFIPCGNEVLHGDYAFISFI